MKRLIAILALCILTFGCAAEPQPYPRYYYKFKNGDVYQVFPAYENGDCAGGIHFRLADGAMLTKLQYEKPRMIKCLAPEQCFEYKKCRKLEDK